MFDNIYEPEYLLPSPPPNPIFNLEYKYDERLYVPSININVIYLIDVTSSMKKHENIINLIKGANQKLNYIHKYIEFGFILYRDYPIDVTKYELELNPEHIEVIEPSTYRFLPSEIVFYGGDDYAEDWANAYYAASQLNS